jgi:hypothetical protein
MLNLHLLFVVRSCFGFVKYITAKFEVNIIENFYQEENLLIPWELGSDNL